MTITDLTCDVCGRGLAGLEVDIPDSPARGTRVTIHPGEPMMHDNSILVCSEPCWAGLIAELGPENVDDVCAACGSPVTYGESLHVSRSLQKFGQNPTWQFCRRHGAEFMNRFRFVDPKIDEDELKLATDFPPKAPV